MALAALIAQSLARPLPPEIRALAAHLLAERRGVAAILAYGSCLRGVATSESLVDLYVLTDDLADVSPNPVSRLGCRLVPPNVHYLECDVEGRTCRAKYAVLPLALFAAWMRRDNPYFWARFSQPAALVYAAGDGPRSAVAAALAEAIRTMFAAARGLSENADPLALWATGFAATYRTELRAEAASRAEDLVAANPAYYRAVSAELEAVEPAPADWNGRRRRGRLWSMVRLAKAAFTFAGGADYLVWKIERHSGHKIALSDWQRRHPLLAGLMLLPQLLKRGAVR
jgi:hypothetical protein